MPPVRAAGCGWRSSASRPSTISSRATPRSPSRTRRCTPARLRHGHAARRRASEQLAKTWAGEEYWFWARRVLRKLRHGIRRAGRTGKPPAGTGDGAGPDPGAPAARRQHRHDRARHGQLRPRRAAPRRPARRLAQREGAHRRLRRQLHRRRRRRPSPRSRRRWPASTGSCATTARQRDLAKAVLTPEQAVAEMRRRIGEGQRCGILFGPERNGLETEEVANADAAVMAPVNPNFASLNLAQAVLLIELRVDEAGRRRHAGARHDLRGAAAAGPAGPAARRRRPGRS